MGKTTAQKDAHAVKDGIGQKDVYVTAVGDTTKAYFFFKPASNIMPGGKEQQDAICSAVSLKEMWAAQISTENAQ